MKSSNVKMPQDGIYKDLYKELYRSSCRLSLQMRHLVPEFPLLFSGLFEIGSHMV